jgi:predicted nucleic acid-binding protein
MNEPYSSSVEVFAQADEPRAALRASVRRHRRAQDDRWTLRSIRPKRATNERPRPPVGTAYNTFIQRETRVAAPVSAAPGPAASRCSLRLIRARSAGPGLLVPLVPEGLVTRAWLFRDAHEPEADALIAKLPNLEMLVPRLWHLEVANVLMVGTRRKRCSQADTTPWLAYLAGLPIVLDGATELQAWSRTVNPARRYGQSTYDASYLELALRAGIPLAKLDAPLRGAARASGVPVYQP